MSAIGSRNARSRRGRVLVVGSAADAPRWSELLAQPPAQARNMFEAISDVASSGIGDAVAAVIVAEELLRTPHERAVEALRKIDPSVRVVAMTRAVEAPVVATGTSAATRGPDAWLSLPIRADELRRAMDDDGLLASATSSPGNSPGASSPGAIIDLDADDDAGSLPHEPSAPARPAQHSAAPRHAPPIQDVETTSATSRSTNDASARPAAVTPAAIPATFSHSRESENVASASVGSTPSPPMTQPTPISAIGDTDLIHALLHSTEGVLPLALRLIGHHGGWSNVRLMALDAAAAVGESATPHASEGVEVNCGPYRFGRLAADPLTHIAPPAPAQLRAWADWLGHWLNIEREHRRLLHLSNCDDLTGAWNRRFFGSFLANAIARARVDRRPVTVMVFDIDNFKVYNDQYGHEAGDDILREIVRLLKSVIRGGDIVCRIGGDEFVVVFADPEGPRSPGSKHPESVESIARRFQQAVCSMRFPKLGVEAAGTLSVSAGLASFPWDGQDAAALLRHADRLALESKRKGKNTITLGLGVSATE